MRQVFCKTNSHVALSLFFHPLLFITPSLFLASQLPSWPFPSLSISYFLLWDLPPSFCPFGFTFLMPQFCYFCSPLLLPSFLLCTSHFGCCFLLWPSSFWSLIITFFFVSFCPFCAFFTYSMLSPAISNQLPSSSFFSSFCPTLVSQARSFLSCCISLSYFLFLILFPLPTSPPCGLQCCCCCMVALSHSHQASFQDPLAAPGVSVPFLPLSLSMSLLFPLCSQLFPPLASSFPKGRWFRTNVKLQGSNGLWINFHQCNFIPTCCFARFNTFSNTGLDDCFPHLLLYWGTWLEALCSLKTSAGLSPGSIDLLGSAESGGGARAGVTTPRQQCWPDGSVHRQWAVLLSCLFLEALGPLFRVSPCHFRRQCHCSIQLIARTVT